MPRLRSHRRSEAVKRSFAARSRPSITGFVRRQGTGQRHVVRQWKTFGVTGLAHKLAIPEESPDKDFVLVVGDSHLQNIVDGFVAMPEGLLSFGFMSTVGACAMELRRELDHAPDFRTPDAVCLMAPGNHLTTMRARKEAGAEFRKLLASACSKWHTKVFVLDFPPRLNIEPAKQTFVRQEFQRVAKEMGVKYVTTAEHFPMDQCDLWSRDGVHLSDSDGMPILVQLLWNAAYEHLHPTSPTLPAAPETSPPRRQIVPKVVVTKLLMASTRPSKPCDCTAVGQGRKRSPAEHLVQVSATSKRRMVQQQVHPAPSDVIAVTSVKQTARDVSQPDRQPAIEKPDRSSYQRNAMNHKCHGCGHMKLHPTCSGATFPMYAELETMEDIKVGGWSHTMYTDKETQWICDQVRSLVQGKTNKIYQEYRAVLSRNQPVKGTNYLFQVRVGEGIYIHVQVYQALPCNGGWLQLSGVLEDKTKDEPLEPISD